MNQQGTEGRADRLDLDAAGPDLWENDLVAGTVTRPATRIYAELGYTPAEVSTLTEGLFSLMHPDDVAGARAALAEHVAGRSARYRCDFRMRAKRGEWVWYANHGEIVDRDGPEPGRRFVGVTFNVDAARHAAARQASLGRAVKLLSSCGTALLQAQSEQALLESICALAVDGAGYVMAWAGFPDDSPQQFLIPRVMAGGSELHLLEQALRSAPDDIRTQHAARRALRESRSIVVDDLLAEASMSFWRQAALHRGFRSSIALPLLAGGVAFGVLSIYAPETHAFSGDEVKLLEELAGNLAYGITALRDRAERAQATAAADRESERAQALLHHAGDGIHIVDGNCRLLEANDSFCAMLNYPREQLLGKFIWEWDAALDETRIKATIADLLAHPRKVRFETIHRRRDGSHLHVEVSCNAVAIGGVDVVFNSSRDISERKYAEAALLRKQGELGESEARHRELLEKLRTGIVVHRIGHGVVFSNPRASALLGVSAAQMRREGYTGQGDGQLHYIDEQGERIGLDDYPANRVRLTRRPVHGMLMGVVRARAAGTPKAPTWLLVSAFPEFAADGTLTQVVVNFEDISARRRAEQKVQHMAFYDVLTGLPNRRLLLDRLENALAASAASGLHGALLCVDLDKFKSINDLYGHDRGDRMLVQVAMRLRQGLRDSDTLARIGGDEFVVLLPELAADAGAASQIAAHMAESLRQVLGLPFDLGGQLHRTTPSIGVTLFGPAASHPDKPVKPDTLLRQADIAMYKAKDGGRNTLRFFSAAMQLAVETHATLEADLRHAVPSGQLRLHYQLQVDAAGRPIGAEALVRWMHPVRGMVSPLHFIGIAEESSLILDIGAWVLEAACAQLALWSLDPVLAGLTLAVNVSARQFREARFVDSVAAALARHGQACGKLKLELTESVIVNDVDDIVRKMHQLRAMGVALSMDDFGTGYSSLAYLKQLPLDQIKIDQSFTRDIALDPNDAIMVKTIIDLARNFRLHVIAEGVETVEQLSFLRANGCPAYQGYLFGRPDEVGRFEAQVRLAAVSVAPPLAEMQAAPG